MIVAGCVSFSVLVSDDLLHLPGRIRAPSGQVYPIQISCKSNNRQACSTEACWEVETAVTSHRQRVYCTNAISDAVRYRIQRSEVRRNLINGLCELVDSNCSAHRALKCWDIVISNCSSYERIVEKTPALTVAFPPAGPLLPTQRWICYVLRIIFDASTDDLRNCIWRCPRLADFSDNFCGLIRAGFCGKSYTSYCTLHPA